MILSDLMKSCFTKGQSAFTNSIKEALYRTDNDIFDKIDFYDDTIYLEPLLFNHFTKGSIESVSLSQILAKHLKSDYSISVRSNKYGQIYLSNLFYLETSRTEDNLEFIDNTLLSENEEVVYEKLACTYVKDTNIEICSYVIPGMNRFYQNWRTTKQVRPINLGDPLFIRSKKLIELAFNLVREYSPQFYEYCIKSTSKIILFESSEIPGFVTREAHGTIYLSVHDDISLAFFIDEIVHQCGHNIFNAVTCKLNEFIKIDPNTSLQALVGHDRVSESSIDGAYHGVFTVCTGIQVLNDIYESAELNDRNKHELKGRLGVKGQRFRTWNEDINLSDIFTPKGIDIFNHLDSRAKHIIDKRSELFKDLDFSNQPYAFSYEKFHEANEI